MNIRAKIITVSLVTTIAAILSFGLYFSNQVHISSISDEQKILKELEKNIYSEHIELSKFLLTEAAMSYGKWEEKRKTTITLYGKVQNFAVLPSLNDELAKSLEIILNLHDLSMSNVEKLDKSYWDFIRSAEEVLRSTNQLELFELFKQSKLLEKYEGFPILLNEADSLHRTIQRLAESYDIAESVLHQQIALIDEEVRIKTEAVFLYSLITFIVLISASFIIATFMGNLLAKRIKLLESEVKLMASGDISTVIRLKGRDEIFHLGKYINELNASLRSAMEKMNTVSNNNIRAKNEMIRIVDEASSAASEMSAGSNSIKNQVEILTEEAQGNVLASDDIEDSLRDLNGQIESQTTMVDQSTASVAQMIASIKSVQQQTDMNREATENLIEQSKKGGENLSRTIANISEVEQFVNKIEEILKMINNIASQTNLLAMNAAIEAAHAGDAGRGFSVVAAEIRKLSEAASSNAKEISGILKEVSHSIHSAADSGRTTSSSFARIENYIETVTNSFYELNLSMKELSTGSNDVLEAMGNLAQTSRVVRDNSQDINKNKEIVKSSAMRISEISNFLSGAIGEISTGIGGVSVSINRVHQMSESIGKTADELNGEIARFRLTGQDS